MKINSNDFRVREGDDVNLRKWPTRIDPVYKSAKQYAKLLEHHVTQLNAMQQLHYATNRNAILLIFQAMDAAGKDGAIRHVMSGVNPQGCEVFSFKHPSATELEHDFLWRTTRDLPERGSIGISATSTLNSPWYVVPADDKENARLIVSRIVLAAFKGLKMTYPKSNAKRRRELLAIRKRLAK